MSKTKTESKFKLKNYISYIMVIAVLGVSVILQLTGNLQRSASTLLVQIAYSIILAVSLNLVVGFLGELSLGHAGFMCVGAYLGGYIAIQLSNFIGSKLLVLIISMLAGGVIAAIFGLIVGLPALRLKGDYLAIVTLAFGEIVRTIFKNLDVFGKAMGLRTNTIKYDTRNDTSLYIVAFVVVLIVLFMINNLIRSKHGRAITAIRDNEIAAKAMGINVTSTSSLCSYSPHSSRASQALSMRITSRPSSIRCSRITTLSKFSSWSSSAAWQASTVR